ncbi:hypothetical protein A0J48_011515 [Sphaerospermopsis aphanizomenoides BCCUSP55]|uniref:hypothetical protein n=1 Tax=Sphaerospermopsis aphanizomenoides TaxID=459663 RepID=UPI0019090128|nr:hypothetical protein [Sphaerospermopsis aphanizomenoides]MBK1988157.1 hypothetical protein [Sphaerospermopsis aphanizomenoides BCCUSP55]
MSVSKEIFSNDVNSVSNGENNISVESLAQQWAKKYLQSLHIDPSQQKNSPVSDLSEISSSAGREKTATKIRESLRSISAKAWNKTEILLSAEVKQHGIDYNLINPWDIAADSFRIYEKVLSVYTDTEALRASEVINMTESDCCDEQKLLDYAEKVAPNQLATVVGSEISAIRKKYTNADPRVIGFVSMQFHYTSQMLIQLVEPVEQSLISAYFKVIDDHLYMPLQRAYEAAAKHNYNSPVLSAVQQLLPVSTQIAKNISQRVIELFPAYSTMSGKLSDPVVKISSIRDVEMFQVYLWVCALEGSIAAIQQELFPLCVMLYPTLKVQWEMVRQMLHLLRYEISDRLTPQQTNSLMPYFQALSQMFSSEILH